MANNDKIQLQNLINMLNAFMTKEEINSSAALSAFNGKVKDTINDEHMSSTISNRTSVTSITDNTIMSSEKKYADNFNVSYDDSVDMLEFSKDGKFYNIESKYDDNNKNENNEKEHEELIETNNNLYNNNSKYNFYNYYVKKIPKPPYIVEITNLPMNTRPAHILTLFSDYDINSVNIPRKNNSIMGYSLVEFENYNHFLAAVNMHEPKINGNVITITMFNSDKFPTEQEIIENVLKDDAKQSVKLSDEILPGLTDKKSHADNEEIISDDLNDVINISNKVIDDNCNSDESILDFAKVENDKKPESISAKLSETLFQRKNSIFEAEKADNSSYLNIDNFKVTKGSSEINKCKSTNIKPEKDIRIDENDQKIHDNIVDLVEKGFNNQFVFKNTDFYRAYDGIMESVSTTDTICKSPKLLYKNILDNYSCVTDIKLNNNNDKNSVIIDPLLKINSTSVKSELRISEEPPYIAQLTDIPSNTNTLQIYKLFSEYDINAINIPQDCNGILNYATIEFEKHEHLLAAIKKSNLQINGKNIRINIQNSNDKLIEERLDLLINDKINEPNNININKTGNENTQQINNTLESSTFECTDTFTAASSKNNNTNISNLNIPNNKVVLTTETIPIPLDENVLMIQKMISAHRKSNETSIKENKQNIDTLKTSSTKCDDIVKSKYDSIVSEDPPYVALLKGLPSDTKPLDITNLLSNYEIMSINMPCVPRNNNRIMGYAFVEFQQRKDLLAVLEISKPEINDVSIKINIPNSGVHATPNKFNCRNVEIDFGNNNSKEIQQKPIESTTKSTSNQLQKLPTILNNNTSVDKPKNDKAEPINLTAASTLISNNIYGTQLMVKPYVGLLTNVSRNANPTDILIIFAKFDINSIKICIPPDENCLSHAFVDFENFNDFISALALSGPTIKNIAIKIEIYDSNKDYEFLKKSTCENTELTFNKSKPLIKCDKNTKKKSMKNVIDGNIQVTSALNVINVNKQQPCNDDNNKNIINKYDTLVSQKPPYIVTFTNVDCATNINFKNLFKDLKIISIRRFRNKVFVEFLNRNDLLTCLQMKSVQSNDRTIYIELGNNSKYKKSNNHDLKNTTTSSISNRTHKIEELNNKSSETNSINDNKYNDNVPAITLSNNPINDHDKLLRKEPPFLAKLSNIPKITYPKLIVNFFHKFKIGNIDIYKTSDETQISYAIVEFYNRKDLLLALQMSEPTLENNIIKIEIHNSPHPISNRRRYGSTRFLSNGKNNALPLMSLDIPEVLIKENTQAKSSEIKKYQIKLINVPTDSSDSQITNIIKCYGIAQYPIKIEHVKDYVLVIFHTIAEAQYTVTNINKNKNLGITAELDLDINNITDLLQNNNNNYNNNNKNNSKNDNNYSRLSTHNNMNNKIPQVMENSTQNSQLGEVVTLSNDASRLRQREQPNIHDKDAKIGVCELCSITSYFKCGNCSYFYCSENCQTLDWPKHSVICLPMPKLINCKLIDENKLNSIVKDQTPLQQKQPKPIKQQIKPIEQPKQLKQSSQEQEKQLLENFNKKTINTRLHHNIPDSRSYVTITSIPNTQNLFIRPIIGSGNTNYLATLEIIKKYSKTKLAIKTQPQVGEMFLVNEITEYGDYHRGIILKMSNNNNVIVALIDYGTVLEKNIKDFYYLDPMIQEMPCYVIPVKLKNVTSVMKNECIVNYLNSLYESVIDLQIVYDEYDQNIGVDLFTVGKMECINEKIIELYNNANM